MFAEGQELPSPYHATKYEAERLVREQDRRPVARLPARRSSSATAAPGEMDKVDGPYYFLPVLTSIGELPGARHLPLVLPDLGDTNVVPVDYVADAMDALLHEEGLDGRAFHLGTERMVPLLDVYNALAKAAGAPQVVLPITPPAAALRGRGASALLAAVAGRPQHRGGARRPPGHPAVGDPAQHVPPGLLDRRHARGARPARRRAAAGAAPSTRTRCTCTGRSTWTRCARAGVTSAAR